MGLFALLKCLALAAVLNWNVVRVCILRLFLVVIVWDSQALGSIFEFHFILRAFILFPVTLQLVLSSEATVIVLPQLDFSTCPPIIFVPRLNLPLNPTTKSSELLRRFANCLRFSDSANHGNYRRAVSPLVPNLLFFCRDMFGSPSPLPSPFLASRRPQACLPTDIPGMCDRSRSPNKFQTGSLHASAYIATLTG